MGRVRIIGGYHRSRIIQFKDGLNSLRPTPDRVRETLFNWLKQDLTGKTCLDLFSGSGALGFEAVSRGATSITFVEKSKVAYQDLKTNIALLKLENITLINTDALFFINNTCISYDVIFLDPPYSSDLMFKCLQQIIKTPSILSQRGVIYIEYQVLPDLNGYEIIKSGKASQVSYALIRLKPDIDKI